MSKIKRMFEKAIHRNVTENLTKEELKYREIDEIIELQRIARNERTSFAPRVWLNQEEIKRIDDRVSKEREIHGVYSKQNNSDIIKTEITDLIKKIKSDVERENESALTFSIMGKVQDMWTNQGGIVGDNPSTKKIQNLIKKHFIYTVLNALGLDIEKDESEDESEFDICDPSENFASISVNEDTDLLIDIEKLENKLIDGRKRAAIASAMKSPLYALLGVFRRSFWIFSKTKRSYLKGQRAERVKFGVK